MTYSCSGRPNAIEHVCTKSDGDHDIFWVTNTHDIAGLHFGQYRCTSLNPGHASAEHILLEGNRKRLTLHRIVP